MKFIRIILFPVVPIYYFVTWLRNRLYDAGIKSSKSYDFPVICVGNLSTGGTGKTPMIEYLIRLLKDDNKIATLSRGYKRKTKGFVLANNKATAETIGDEPFQIYSKFENITVAVDANRQNGIEQLRALPNKPEVILLDDAFQHRKVKAKLNILLTAYNNLFFTDMVLPTGNLREPRAGYKRADIIVVTKCPDNLGKSEKSEIINGISPLPHQKVFFSKIRYGSEVISTHRKRDLCSLPPFTLVTGIANDNPLVEFLNSLKLEFEHLKYADHYNYTESDIIELEKKELIVTTEKDFVRLKEARNLTNKLFYIPIEIDIDNSKRFTTFVNSFLN